MSAHRSGYVAIVGRPNVGKSTLLNRLLGQKISIVSHRPQTTRNKVVGLLNRDDLQAVFVDTPGIHEAHKLLNEKMVEAAWAATRDVDLILLLIEADVDTDPARFDAGILERLKGSSCPVLLVPNKIDKVTKHSLLPLIAAWSEALEPAAIVPVSALKGDGDDMLIAAIEERLPEGPAWYPKDQLTVATERFVVAELIREQLFHQLEQELPYATAVEIEEFKEGKTVKIMARIWVERDSQKGIVIGKQGSRLKEIGTRSREQIQRLLGCKVYLQLTVGVDPKWTTRKSSVRKLGWFGEES